MTYKRFPPTPAKAGLQAPRERQVAPPAACGKLRCWCIECGNSMSESRALNGPRGLKTLCHRSLAKLFQEQDLQELVKAKALAAEAVANWHSASSGSQGDKPAASPAAMAKDLEESTPAAWTPATPPPPRSGAAAAGEPLTESDDEVITCLQTLVEGPQQYGWKQPTTGPAAAPSPPRSSTWGMAVLAGVSASMFEHKYPAAAAGSGKTKTAARATVWGNEQQVLDAGELVLLARLSHLPRAAASGSGLFSRRVALQRLMDATQELGAEDTAQHLQKQLSQASPPPPSAGNLPAPAATQQQGVHKRQKLQQQAVWEKQVEDNDEDMAAEPLRRTWLKDDSAANNSSYQQRCQAPLATGSPAWFITNSSNSSLRGLAQLHSSSSGSPSESMQVDAPMPQAPPPGPRPVTLSRARRTQPDTKANNPASSSGGMGSSAVVAGTGATSTNSSPAWRLAGAKHQRSGELLLQLPLPGIATAAGTAAVSAALAAGGLVLPGMTMASGAQGSGALNSSGVSPLLGANPATAAGQLALIQLSQPAQLQQVGGGADQLAAAAAAGGGNNAGGAAVGAGTPNQGAAEGLQPPAAQGNLPSKRRRVSKKQWAE